MLFSFYSAYIVELLGVLEVLKLAKESELQAIELHIYSKMVIQNILDFKHDSIIKMRLIQKNSLVA